MKQQIDGNDLIQVAKRENNPKRHYLYVNPLQGKHLPVSPSRSLALFASLAEEAAQRFAGERLLVVGFAETATAIGAALAYGAGNVDFYCSTAMPGNRGWCWTIWQRSCPRWTGWCSPRTRSPRGIPSPI